MRETISVLEPSREGDLYTEQDARPCAYVRSFIRGRAALGKSFGLAVLIPGREKSTKQCLTWSKLSRASSPYMPNDDASA